MMSSTYPNSIMSVRTSFYFNGYSSYPNEICPSSYFTCSCSIPLNNGKLIAPINPNSLYGLRQSTLIQLPPSRRLILGSSYRSPCCCVKQERVGRFVEKSCEEECCIKERNIRVRVNEIRSRLGRSNYRCSALGDVDGMIDLLAGNSIVESLDDRRRKRSSFKEEKFVEKRNYVSERSKEREMNAGSEGRSGIRSKKDVHLSREEFKKDSRDEYRKSCTAKSSYHQVLDSGDFESDMEVKTKHEKGSRKAGGSVDDLTVGNSTEWDWRKKLEKKLTEESTEENIKSSNVSSVSKSQLNHSYEINSMNSSSSKKRLNYHEGESSSHIKSENQVSEYLKSSNKHEQSMQADRNEAETSSVLIRRSNKGEESMGCDYCKECDEILQKSKTRTHIQQNGELSENREDTKGTVVVENQSESRLRHQDNNSTSLQSSSMEVLNVQKESKSRLRMHEQSVTSLQTSVMEENKLKMGESILRSQRRQSESRMKNLEDFSTSTISRKEEELRAKVINEVESNEELRTELNASQLHPTIVEINRQSKSVEELVDKRKQIIETNVHFGLSNGKHEKILQASLTGNSLEETTVTQQSSTASISRTGVDQLNKMDMQSSLQISIISPSYQLAGNLEPSPSISLLSNDNASNTELGVIGATVHPQVRKSFKEPSPEHALSEFVEDTNHEASTSETKTENLSEHDSNHRDDQDKLERSSKSKFDKTILQKQDSRPSLGEIWVVKDHSVRESSEIESSEAPTSGDVVNRTGKSLWNVIARVFRLRWVSKSESQTSPVISGGLNSSHDSASSETRVSRKEMNEATSDSLESGQKSFAQKLISSDQTLLKKENSIRTNIGSLGVMGSDEKITNVNVGASSSSSVLQAGLLLGVVSAGANPNWNFAQEKPQLTPSDSSKNPSRRPKKSYSSEKSEEFDQNEGFVSSKEEQGDKSSEIIMVEPKSGKLKRSEQVLEEERFDEWEDAYKHEHEQRRVDEIFMREALVEAKKAADSWEVPVGAVLVQNGKIIARGYNLVEELRDSTAHAEIICIREGSSILRTWRLSETTLYVTLEPCPMCAGAILQARVGTLVWGAPNKLLGADGSWIRIFPGGAEGEERPEVANKPAAPIHPFHPKMKIRRGVLEPECAEIMQQFFQLRRKNKKKTKEDNKSQEPGQQPSCLPIHHHPSKLLHKMHHIFHILFCSYK